MQKAATDVMQAILYAAVVDAIAALKAASKGVPNELLRDLQSVHANTTFADLPKELQESIAASVRAAFTQLLREGYSVAPKGMAPVSPPRREAFIPRRGPPPDRRPRSGPRNGPPSDPGKGPTGPGKGPGGPRRPRPPKGKPRLS